MTKPIPAKKIKFFLKNDVRTIADLDALADEVNTFMCTQLYTNSMEHQIQVFVTSMGGEKVNVILLMEWEEVDL